MIKPGAVLGLFPVAVYQGKINRSLSTKELDFIHAQKNNSRKSEGNHISNERYLLDKPLFKKLKKEMNDHINIYVRDHLKWVSDTKLFITQSWLNWTEHREFHHIHNHPNSALSAVFYIDADPAVDKIQFYHPYLHNFIIRPEVTEFNMFNSRTWWVGARTGDVILFPSSLTHSVTTKEGTNTRVSLAFNVFVKGKVGSFDGLTELIT